MEHGEIASLLERLKEEAERAFQRRLLAFFGGGQDTLQLSVDFLRSRGEGALILTASGELPGVKLPEGFSLLAHNESEKLLGRTYENLIMDLTENLVPNDLGRAVGLIKGGGLVLLLLPHDFLSQVNVFHRNTLPPPFTPGDVRHYFAFWLKRTLLEADGVAVVEDGNVVKDGLTDAEEWVREPVVVPDGDSLKNIKSLALTRDQLRAVEEIIFFLQERPERGALILVADRGRGKSAALGLAAAAIPGERAPLKMAITSAEREMAEEVFRFFRRGLNLRGVKYREGRGNFFEGEGWTLQYLPPPAASEGRWDVLFVDEAAAIPYRLLLKMARRARSPVFSTTIHGYEGSGRSFSVRFIQGLTQERFDLRKVKMEEPIRYSPDDPVERWLFRALMLSAEPGEMPGKIDRRRLRFNVEVAGEVLERNEEFFRSYFGIFVLAHYKNTPNDLALLLDGPNQWMASLSLKGTPLVALQLAEEGSLSRQVVEKIYSGWIPPGNLIPDCLIKYYRDESLGGLKGLRIVRIATHPHLQGRGLGSEALKRLEEWAQRGGFDYLGTSYGATEELLNFWLKNGYTPVHVSPSPNPVSGEHSVIMIKPLSEDLKRRLNDLKESFIRRTLEALPDPLRDVEPEVVRLLINPPSVDFSLKMTEEDLKRAVAYAWGTMTYVVSRDVVLPYVKAYFSTKRRPALERSDEILLISRVLQCRSWDETHRLIRKGPVYTMIRLKDVMKLLIRYFTGEEIEKEIGRYPTR